MKSLYVILCLMVVLPQQSQSAKINKNTAKTSPQAQEAASERAIIAIEIVDPNENSTSSKQSKRTIESALGYGYNSYDKPRYEVYKYSQHDIPPYKGTPTSVFTGSQDSVKIEKSVQYTLPSVTEQVPDTTALKPGTTLYSSLGSQGQVGGLTSSLSSISGLEQNQAPVPVIVLRIYPDQLKDSTIQANLPKSHPFAKSINSINIQSLLLHYIKALQSPASVKYTAPVSSTYSASTSDYSSNPSQAQVGSAPGQDYASYQTQYQQSADYQGSSQYYQQPSFYQKPIYQQQSSQYSDYNSGRDVQVQPAPVKYQFRYQTPTVAQKPSSKKSRPFKRPQFYYVQPNAQSSYTTEANQYYPTSQPVDYSQQDLLRAAAPQAQQYYSTNQVEQQQYPEYYEQPYDSSQKLLTSENYPSNAHTRVVFKTDDGNVKTPEVPNASKEIKTIKIQVPDNISKVEVQESERPYYSSYQSEPTHPDVAPNYAHSNYENPDSNYPAEGNTYVGQDSVRQDYYNTADAPSEGTFDYQNVDFERMAKYFVRRGAMPSHFFQNPDDDDDTTQKRMNKEDVVAAYEEAAFPSTTQSTEEKKVKSKKRTRGI